MENKIGVFSVFRTGELKSILLMILKHLNRYEIYLFMAYTNYVFVDMLDWTTILGWFLFVDYGENAKYHCQGKRFKFYAFQAYCKDEIGRKESKRSMPYEGICDSKENLRQLFPRYKGLVHMSPIQCMESLLHTRKQKPRRRLEHYYGTNTKESPRQLYHFDRLNCLGEGYDFTGFGYNEITGFIKKFSK